MFGDKARIPECKLHQVKPEFKRHIWQSVKLIFFILFTIIILLTHYISSCLLTFFAAQKD